MTYRLVKTIIIVGLAILATGCKLAVITNEGGTVQSLSDTRNCAQGTICTIDITDPNFSESFTAVAQPGYKFTKWQDGNGFICAASTNSTCTFKMTGDAISVAAVAEPTKLYAMPIFEFVGFDTDSDGIKDHVDKDDDNDGIFDEDDSCPLDPSPGCSTALPITDTMLINGREWAQVDLFSDLSWNEMNAVCPEGACSGSLNGHAMQGWTWASLDDVNGLFNYLVGRVVFGPDEGTRSYSEYGSSWAPQLFSYGMRPTSTLPEQRYVSGISRNTVSGDPAYTWTCYFMDKYPNVNDDGIYFQASSKSYSHEFYGGWFYRTPHP